MKRSEIGDRLADRARQFFFWYDNDKDLKRPGFAAHVSLPALHYVRHSVLLCYGNWIDTMGDFTLLDYIREAQNDFKSIKHLKFNRGNIILISILTILEDINCQVVRLMNVDFTMFFPHVNRNIGAIANMG